ncbi:hypothetical protein O159_27300 [Leifsonia xyli subsp. cynodontis DSM 46306]|uniref:C4-dicarboxylate ABC transporter n=1 Tax=Leifsonia xyli subsp. cynodontis DSM 46306 TaxID=1389489 RepID=U3PAQ4_LEIXC|nr:hypothetical protein [Leifsonia xyli]AGW42624.1 hypothetical protein O159_27300 [Leifsonia xyli subsp. cynodontis DSM 46306]
MNRFRFEAVTPNWFAAVMGTGIVANALAGFPGQLPGMRAAVLVFWLLAAVLLVFLLAATALHWLRHPEAARGHHRHPVMAHFYGAPPMAMLTVGAGALLVGHDLIGDRAALAVDAVLWTAGTVLGLFAAAAIPYLVFTRLELADDAAFGGWLMPVVLPMVSAATGALLLPHLDGAGQHTMLLACLGMFGMSLLASFFIVAQLWTRLTRHKIGASTMVPTLWIVLGPLGQSVTALTLLARESGSPSLRSDAVLVGTPILGFALLWLAIAAAITLSTARQGMPFALTWWSFTFPVGTCATGAAGLAIVTGSPALTALAAGFLVLLLAAWLVVATRTVAAQLPGRAPAASASAAHDTTRTTTATRTMRPAAAKAATATGTLGSEPASRDNPIQESPHAEAAAGANRPRSPTARAEPMTATTPSTAIPQTSRSMPHPAKPEAASAAAMFATVATMTQPRKRPVVPSKRIASAIVPAGSRRSRTKATISATSRAAMTRTLRASSLAWTERIQAAVRSMDAVIHQPAAPGRLRGKRLPDRKGGEAGIDDAPDGESGTGGCDKGGIRSERAAHRLRDGTAPGETRPRERTDQSDDGSRDDRALPHPVGRGRPDRSDREVVDRGAHGRPATGGEKGRPPPDDISSARASAIPPG